MFGKGNDNAPIRMEATLSGSNLPEWVSCCQALAIPLLGVMVAATSVWIAFRQQNISREQVTIATAQAKIAHAKLALDLFDRRLSVFEASRKFLANMTAHGNATDDDIRAYVINTSDAVFLFDDDNLIALLSEIQKRAINVQVMTPVSDSLPVGDERAAYVRRKGDDFLWLVEQLGLLQEQFKPHLQIGRLTGKVSL